MTSMPRSSPDLTTLERTALDLTDLGSARVLIISDTHGVLDERIAAQATGADAVVHAGDVGSATVLAALDGCPLVAVRGNNDVTAKWKGSAHALASLRDAASIALPGGLLVVEHGHRAGAAKDRHRRLRERHPDARAIVYGHSHRLCTDTDETPWVLNPGAAGRVRTFGGPSYLWLHAGRRRWWLEVQRLSPPP